MSPTPKRPDPHHLRQLVRNHLDAAYQSLADHVDDTEAAARITLEICGTLTESVGLGILAPQEILDLLSARYPGIAAANPALVHALRQEAGHPPPPIRHTDALLVDHFRHIFAAFRQPYDPLNPPPRHDAGELPDP